MVVRECVLSLESVCGSVLFTCYYVVVFLQFSLLTAVIDLNGRFFGGRVVKASFFSEERFSGYDLAP